MFLNIWHFWHYHLIIPIGYALFFRRGLAPPGITIYHIYGSILPFFALQAAGLVIGIIFPQTVLWLPRVVFKE